jgi:outer membrane protein OmpA-like peptidoglycan-associated protein
VVQANANIWLGRTNLRRRLRYLLMARPMVECINCTAIVMNGRFVRAIPNRLVLAWSALLGVGWLSVFSPWSVIWNICAAVMGLCLIGSLIVSSTLRIKARAILTRQALDDLENAIGALPEQVKRDTPVALVAFETPHDKSSGSNAGETIAWFSDGIIWVRAMQPAHLVHLAEALAVWRRGQGPDVIAYLIDADCHSASSTRLREVEPWRVAITHAGQVLGYRIPVCVAVSARQPDSRQEFESPTSPCPWIGESSVDSVRYVSFEPNRSQTLEQRMATRFDQYSAAGPIPGRRSRAFQSARLEALSRWAQLAVLPMLTDTSRKGSPLKLSAFGVRLINGVPPKSSHFRRLISNTTGLHETTSPGDDQSRMASNMRTTCDAGLLPGPLVRAIPCRPRHSPVAQATAQAFVCLALCFCAAAAASAWQNLTLLERVTDHMRLYKSIAPAFDGARRIALGQLKRDVEELECNARSGVPPRLSLGFYRGDLIAADARLLVDAYRPPPPSPATIELNALSLFASGSATLKSGANRALIGALEMIKAYPKSRVLIAGHTDSVGRADRNLTLSIARAVSVRDWLIDASALKSPHFAVQGYGDTRPTASNDNPAGRMANRRVELTLVPEPSASNYFY